MLCVCPLSGRPTATRAVSFSTKSASCGEFLSGGRYDVINICPHTYLTSIRRPLAVNMRDFVCGMVGVQVLVRGLTGNSDYINLATTRGFREKAAPLEHFSMVVIVGIP